MSFMTLLFAAELPLLSSVKIPFIVRHSWKGRKRKKEMEGEREGGRPVERKREIKTISTGTGSIHVAVFLCHCSNAGFVLPQWFISN